MGYSKESNEVQKVLELINKQSEESKKLYYLLQDKGIRYISLLDKPIAFTYEYEGMGDFLVIGDNKEVEEEYSEMNKMEIKMEDIVNMSVEVEDLYDEVSFNIYIKIDNGCEIQIHSLY